MKIVLTFTDDDVVERAMNKFSDQMSPPEIEEKLAKFINNGQYLSVEFDLENGTAIVLEVK